MTESHEKRDQAYAALAELLERVRLHSATGQAYVRLDLNQGHVTNVTLSLEEKYKSKS